MSSWSNFEQWHDGRSERWLGSLYDLGGLFRFVPWFNFCTFIRKLNKMVNLFKLEDFIKQFWMVEFHARQVYKIVLGFFYHYLAVVNFLRRRREGTGLHSISPYGGVLCVHCTARCNKPGDRRSFIIRDQSFCACELRLPCFSERDMKGILYCNL